MAIGIQSGHHVSGFGFALDQGGMLHYSVRKQYEALSLPKGMGLRGVGDCGCGGCPGCNGQVKGLGLTLPELDLRPGADPISMQEGWEPFPVQQAKGRAALTRGLAIGSLAVHALAAAAGLYLLKKKHPVAGTVVTAWGVLGLIPSLVLATNPRNIAV